MSWIYLTKNGTAGLVKIGRSTGTSRRGTASLRLATRRT